MSGSKKLETILVATDFSPDAAAALEWASGIAREHGARIVLVHAVTITTPAVPEFLPIEEQFYGPLRAKAQKDLEQLASSLRERKVPVEIELTVEPIVSNVLAAAEKHGADVIVAGTRGLTGWKRLVLGSVAGRLVRKALCPVVTVRAEDAGRQRAVRTILVAIDFSDDASRAADAATRILGEGPDRRLVLLHVYRYPAVFLSAPANVLARSMKDFVQRVRREIDELPAGLAPQGVVVERHIEEGQPWEVILDHAEQIGADLIAMGTHGRSGFDRLLLGSTAERVLSAAPCPVLTIRSPESKM